MSALLAAILLGLSGLFALILDNLRRFERLVPAGPEAHGARVSVLVPARNEERNLEACLDGLRAQADSMLEIRVLDDDSQDRTAEIVREAAAHDPRIALLAGKALPEGWKGKNHACWQLAAEASGDWLLFLDADVRLAPGAVASALAMAEAREADLLSVFPEQDCRTLGEKLFVPMLGFVLLTFLPFRLLDRPDPSLAAANGQFMLFRKDAYRAIGGHEAIKAEIVEDIVLARRIKHHGKRLILADGTGSVSCRMYRSFGEIWHGFSKNLYPAFGGKPLPFVFSMGLVTLLFLAPWGLLAVSEARTGAFLAVLLALGMRLALAWRLRQSPWAILGHPVAIGFLLALGLRSFWVARSGRTVPWKGRSYSA